MLTSAFPEYYKMSLESSPASLANGPKSRTIYIEL